MFKDDYSSLDAMFSDEETDDSGEIMDAGVWVKKEEMDPDEGKHDGSVEKKSCSLSDRATSIQEFFNTPGKNEMPGNDLHYCAARHWIKFTPKDGEVPKSVIRYCRERRRVAEEMSELQEDKRRARLKRLHVLKVISIAKRRPWDIPHVLYDVLSSSSLILPSEHPLGPLTKKMKDAKKLGQDTKPPAQFEEIPLLDTVAVGSEGQSSATDDVSSQHFEEAFKGEKCVPPSRITLRAAKFGGVRATKIDVTTPFFFVRGHPGWTLCNLDEWQPTGGVRNGTEESAQKLASEAGNAVSFFDWIIPAETEVEQEGVAVVPWEEPALGRDDCEEPELIDLVMNFNTSSIIKNA